MYKLTVTSILMSSLSMSASAVAENDNLYLPRLKCTYTQDSFYSEIIFKKPDSHPETKGFDGELRHYVIQSKTERKFISGAGFKAIFYKRGSISGLIGDAFGSTGTFTMISLSSGKSGTWRFTSTDLSGTSTQALFTCAYGPVRSPL